MKEKEQLAKELAEAKAVANNAIDFMDKYTKESTAKKNRVQGGYYMMSRRAEQSLRELQVANPTSALVFSIIREYMEMGTNAVTVSNEALAKMLGKSTRTIIRATKYLCECNYVQVIKTGTSNTYVVNERVAFSGSAGQRKAVFSSTIIAHECEQPSAKEEKPQKLKQAPVISYAKNKKEKQA